MPDGHDGTQFPRRPPLAPVRGRRLTDKILASFHHACDQGDLEVAERLLRVVETILRRRDFTPDTDLRRHKESLVAAYERLWALRHPEAKDE